MKHPTRISLVALAVGMGLSAIAATVQANMFDFMNPGRWFDSDRDRDRYYYGPGRYGGYGPYGYGPYGYGGGPYGWGGPYGYGGGPYGGWGGYPGSTIVVTPQSGGSREAAPPPRLPE